MSRNDFGLRFGEPAQYYGNVPDGRTAMKRGGDVMPKRNKKNFRPTEKGAGMTRAGVGCISKSKSRFKTKNSGHWQSQTRIKSCKET